MGQQEEQSTGAPRQELRPLRLVVVSPSDVAAERDIVTDVVRQLNHGVCSDRALVLVDYRWEIDCWVPLHPDGFQRGVVDEVLKIDQADAIIAIFWARLGTSDQNLADQTGSQHELEAALKRLERGSAGRAPPHVAVYHNQTASNIHRKDEEGLAQCAALFTYLKELEQRGQGFVREYDGTASFEQVLLRDLERWLRACFPICSPHPADSFARAVAEYRLVAAAAHTTLELAAFEKRLRIDIDLEALHIPLHALVDLRSQGDAAFADGEDAASRLRESAREIPLSEAFREAKARNRRGLVILGDPGSGKTTQQKQLLLRLLRHGGKELGLANSEGVSPLPVFVRLTAFNDASVDLKTFIGQQIEAAYPASPAGFGKELLRRGNLLLLFDGLDEVVDPCRRAEVARSIEQLVHGPSSCTPVVTCRFAGYGGPTRLGKSFLELHLLPLSPEQAEQFIRNWYRIVERALSFDPTHWERDALARATELVARLRQRNFRAKRMTRNPLLLANICLVHRERRALPKGPAELYEECMELLLEHWRKGKNLTVAVSSEVGRRALQPVALWLHSQSGQNGPGQGGRPTLTTAAQLIPVLEPALKEAGWQGGSAMDFLCRVRDESGLLTGWGPEQFGFMHLGFQEYLAAKEILQQASAGNAGPLHALAAQYGVSWWKEVMLLLLSMGNRSMFERLMREVVKQPAFGETLEPMGLILDEAVEVSVAPFVELLEQVPGDAQHDLWRRQRSALLVLESIAARQALDGLGAQQALDALRERLTQHPLEEIRARVKQVRAGTRSPKDELAGMELVRIPAGTFQMGSPDGLGAPEHEVTLSEFELGKYPVTNEQYARFLQANPEVKEPYFWADRGVSQSRQPVVGLTWDEARTYAEWAGLRLPTEAEWEYACRACVADGQRAKTHYCCGDDPEDLDRVGWFDSNSGGRLHEVGEKLANAFGVCDLHGSVWEWCSDWYGPYEDKPARDPTGPTWGETRVLRGGCWYDPPLLARSAHRLHHHPGSRVNSFGFRLARGARTSK